MKRRYELVDLGWTKIRRFHCLTGHIDKWTGDSADHPDNPTASRIHLNSMVTMYRLDGGDWLSRDFFFTDFLDHFLYIDCDLGEVKAEELFNLCLRSNWDT